MYSVQIELEGDGHKWGRGIRTTDKKTAYEFFEMLKAVLEVMLAGRDYDEA